MLSRHIYQVDGSLFEHTGGDRCELDSHADTIVAGDNMALLEATGETVNITPFSDEYVPLENIPVATCGTAYDDPATGEVLLLVFGQALFFGQRIKGSLIPPNQMRDNGLIVSDVPRQFDRHSPHSIVVQDDDDRELTIPLQLQGVISGFTGRKPTKKEIRTAPRVLMTYEEQWDPNSPHFLESEVNVAQHLAHNPPNPVTISAVNIAEDGRFFDRWGQKRMYMQNR
jgi:hypothetical protein